MNCRKTTTTYTRKELSMAVIPCNQLSLADVFSDCQDIYESDKPAFLSLLQSNIDLDEIIPDSFRNHFYASTGRSRKYPLHAFLWALIIQRIFSISTDSLLIVFLNYSRHLREFCGFNKVPDASKITRFKQAFIDDLKLLFENLVNLTEPICQSIDSEKASMTIFDTSGIEAWVTENNPKYANKIIKQLKAYAKTKNFSESYDPYKAAYGSMPTHAASNSDIKQLYINGHFCYVYKIGVITNGLGILRHLDFYNKDFIASHPEIEVEKKTKSPDEDKSVHDAKLLIPSLSDFFASHPLINPRTFLGDSAFDSMLIYRKLLSGDTFGENRHFEKAYIPLNSRSSIRSIDSYQLDSNGIPCCPNNPDILMKYAGKSHRNNGLTRYKFECPKVKFVKDDTEKYHRKCFCENPCTDSKCGRMIYIYPEQNLRAYPGTIRGTEEWNATYKNRTIVERSINHCKDCFGLSGRKTQNEKTLHADLLLSGITQLVTVLLAEKIHQHQFIRSLKPLIA